MVLLLTLTKMFYDTYLTYRTTKENLAEEKALKTKEHEETHEHKRKDTSTPQKRKQRGRVH